MGESDRRRGGIAPARLTDQQLIRELETIHRTRHDTLLHGSAAALAMHNTRMAQLEGEYLAGTPSAPSRSAAPARARASAAEGPCARGACRTGRTGCTGRAPGRTPAARPAAPARPHLT